MSAQRRHRGCRHRDRAEVAGLDLGREEGERRTGRIAAVPRIVLPGEGVEAVADCHVEQRVPGRVVLDPVHPVPESVVGVEDRPVDIGLEPPAVHLLGGHATAEVLELGECPAGPLAGRGCSQDRVGRGRVVVVQWGRLIEDDVCVTHHFRLPASPVPDRGSRKGANRGPPPFARTPSQRMSGMASLRVCLSDDSSQVQGRVEGTSPSFRNP